MNEIFGVVTRRSLLGGKVNVRDGWVVSHAHEILIQVAHDSYPSLLIIIVIIVVIIIVIIIISLPLYGSPSADLML